jgi:precorrin-3B methylase
MRTAILIAPLLLAACQPSGPEVEVDDGVRALTNACLAEIGAPILPDRVTEGASLELTPEQQAAFEACVVRRS